MSQQVKNMNHCVDNQAPRLNVDRYLRVSDLAQRKDRARRIFEDNKKLLTNVNCTYRLGVSVKMYNK